MHHIEEEKFSLLFMIDRLCASLVGATQRRFWMVKIGGLLVISWWPTDKVGYVTYAQCLRSRRYMEKKPQLAYSVHV